MFVSHLEGAIDGARLPHDRIQTVHNGRPIWVRYDLPAIGRAVRRDDLKSRPPTMWRYAELLPVATSEIVSLGEEMTPLLDCPRLAARLGVSRLLVKDESHLPTGSFKSRGLAMAVSMARRFGITHVAAPTAGNAGGALAAYAARAGMRCRVFMPQDTPAVNKAEAALFGARVYLVNGHIGDCGRLVAQGCEKFGWFNMSTLREPYRIEGKKTMGLELGEQMDWSLPHVILYPTGGGTGLIGMWKAFAELAALGWLNSPSLPRLFSCQSDGCAPIAAAFDKGERFATPPPDPRTMASGLRVPSALGDFMILDAVRASRGRAMAAAESGIQGWMRLAASTEGLSLCPESAVCLGVLERALREGHIQSRETVVLFNTGAAQKYLEVLPAEFRGLDKDHVDWDALAAD